MRRIAIVLLAGSSALALSPARAEDHRHGTHEVVIEHGRFTPAAVEVEVGEAVTWRHDDGDDPQSVTADDGSFDSHPGCTEAAPEKCMRGGQTFEHTFTEAGRFRYHSRTEGGPGGAGMSGVVEVVEHHGDEH